MFTKNSFATLKEERQFIYSLKTFAILSVVSAHSASVSKTDSFTNIIAGNILQSLGSIGVIVFFIVSGFLFASNDRSFIEFFRKRLVTIFLPWVVTGTIVYIYVAIRKDGIDLIDWIFFIMGNKSYLYFMPMLISCYLILFFINKNIILLILIMIISFFSILLTTNNIYIQQNPYMNPLNWFFYFAVGYLLFFFNKISYLIGFAKRNIRFSSIIFFVCLLAFSKNKAIGYWEYEYLFFEFISLICLLYISSQPVIYKSKLINYIGKESFSIYLIHMPFAGMVVYFFRHIDFAVVTLIRPFVILFLSYSAIYVYKYIAKKLNMLGLFVMLIGARD